MFIKSIAVYIADIYTLISLFVSGKWSASILNSDAAKSDSTSSSVLEVPFSVRFSSLLSLFYRTELLFLGQIGKWIFFGCIIFSFLLLLWEARKSRAIIKSRDISYAFTNVMSQNWYALRSYDHYCFFCQIDNSKKKKDEFAFFVFFTFKGASAIFSFPFLRAVRKPLIPHCVDVIQAGNAFSSPTLLVKSSTPSPSTPSASPKTGPPTSASTGRDRCRRRVSSSPCFSPSSFGSFRLRCSSSPPSCTFRCCATFRET
jgi:hypothetical protein